MHSITYSTGYFLASIVVNVFSSEYHFLSEPNVTLTYIPLRFHYKINHDFLLMEIILKNISPSVTAVHLKYDQYYNEYSPNPGEQRIKVNIEKPTSEVKFMIRKALINRNIVIDVELHSQLKICDTTNIADGRDETTLTPYLRNFYFKAAYCVAPIPCKFVVDLKDKCQEQPFTDVSCNIQKSQYICTFNKQKNILIFYQINRDGSYIVIMVPTPEMKMNEWTTTKLNIKLELFDNNTSVKIVTTKNKIIWHKKLIFTAEDNNSEDYSSVKNRRYSETTDVEYSCQEPKQYSYLTKYKMHVGLINTTVNKITTYNTTLIQRKFNMADNGSILCCLYYAFKTVWTYEKHVDINRIVENKTLLVYESQESISNNLSESKEQTKAPRVDWLYIYLLPTFLGISFLMLALYIIKQKHCCTNSQPVEETVQLDNNYATQNQVLYANLDLGRDGHQPGSQNEESHYATIIGSLHPL